LEGPTADFDEKGGGTMPGGPAFPSLRQEVQNYLRSCEHLLSVPAASHNNPSFTSDELQIVNYYAAEVAKMVGQQAKL
jgi:hypothetical protein